MDLYSGEPGLFKISGTRSLSGLHKEETEVVDIGRLHVSGTTRRSIGSGATNLLWKSL